MSKLKGEPPVHGVTTNGYSNYGCRCEECRAAHRAYCLKRRYERAELLFNGKVDAPHGRYTTYSNYGCKCGPCKDAFAEYVRQRRRRKATAL